jgi:GDP-4-dehydro-6-deoxy-D-mannose reductase
MKFLITGAGGFIGKKLTNFLINKNNSVLALTFNNDLFEFKNKFKDNLDIKKIDILDKNSIYKILKDFRPDQIFHLAAQSNPTKSWKYPGDTMITNYNGTLNLLNGIVKFKLRSKLFIFSSSSIYQESKKLISENSIIEPLTPYALSKLAQEKIALIYKNKYKIKSIIVRPFFITGPGKTGDVCSDWASQIVKIEKGEQKILEVGNISGIIRDFLYIDDFLLAIKKLYLNTESGIFNVCSAKAVPLDALLNIFEKKAKKNFKIKKTKSKIRQIENSIIVGDNKKILNLGWAPKFNIEKIVEIYLNYYRLNS